ncbi:MAG: glycine zipper 2TM domain-containing protein [Sulfurospirillum sp.]|nr:glycine zipper 2TM domain-containing protein [Sulfurospirillum sp.]
MKKVSLILVALALSLSAESFSITQNIKVTNSRPIYETVTKQIPYQECRDIQVPTRGAYRSNSSDPIGTLIGGVAGGILGNQVGKGNGRTVATIGGAIVGSLVGNNLSNNRGDYYEESSYQMQQRCGTRYETNHVREFVGYENIAHFQGRKIIKITPHKQSYITVVHTFEY